MANPSPTLSNIRPVFSKLRWLTRVLAFFMKEVNEIRRQPLLILSLVGGPLLVLVLFGAAYQNARPLIRTVIVLPAGGLAGITAAQITTLVGTNFTLQAFSQDRAAAEAQLRRGEIDLVQVVPDDIYARVRRGERPQIEFVSNAINPTDEGWIQYLAYAEVSEINREILRRQAEGAQQEAGTVRVKISDINVRIGTIEANLSEQELGKLRQDLREVRDATFLIASQLPPEGSFGSERSEVRTLRKQLNDVQASLDKADRIFADGTIDAQLTELRNTRDELNKLDGAAQIFVSVPPDLIVSPLEQHYTNLRGSAYSAVVFYAPGIIALLIQHTAVTLGALALVRERNMGALEIFRVAPVNMTQLIVGKYLGYTLIIALSATLLTFVLGFIGIPIKGSLLSFTGLMLMLILAALGIGFLISTIAGTDSQAIQLSMITLLFSIFFSGFFIPITSFASFALPVAYILPMTHGVAGFQAVMLRGDMPAPLTWLGLALIAVIAFSGVTWLTRRQFQRA